MIFESSTPGLLQSIIQALTLEYTIKPQGTSWHNSIWFPARKRESEAYEDDRAELSRRTTETSFGAGHDIP